MNRSRFWMYAALTSILLVVSWMIWPVAQASADPLQTAWQRAQQAGAYRFTSAVTQITHPAAALTSVGQSSRAEQLRLDGRVDVPAQTMEMTLVRNPNEADSGQNGIELRSEHGKAFGRAIGGVWQALDNLPGAVGPSSDLLAYLAGATNVTQLDGGHYRFDLDGPAFSAYLRDQLETSLRERGALPSGVTLSQSEQFRTMSGTGEAWIDGDGLPTRLVINASFPTQANGERIELRATTDFSDFSRAALAVAWYAPARLATTLGLPTGTALYQALLGLGALAFGLALMLLVVRYHRSRRLYMVLATLVIAVLVSGPLTQAHAAETTATQLDSLRAAAAQQQQSVQAKRTLEAETQAAAWDAHRDPLAAAAADVSASVAASSAQQQASAVSNVDTDGDGLTDVQELRIGSDPAKPDTDGDGLSDGQELRIGTSPRSTDTDNDRITDNVEVAGFSVGGKTWYSDPTAADSNQDGLLDSEQCPERVRPSATQLSPTAACRDTDGDGTIDLFDADEDNDGVINGLDLSPQTKLASSSAPLNAQNPFTFSLDQFQLSSTSQQLPVLIDLQLRPKNPAHLSQNLNVLDWPSGDIEGQIRRRRDTTFADTISVSAAAADPRSRNGDVRLIPLLEVSMQGVLPLPMTNPRAVVNFSADVTGTITLSQQGSNVGLMFFANGTNGYNVAIRDGQCESQGAVRSSWNNLSRNQGVIINGSNLLALADGNHVITVQGGGASICEPLVDLPNGNSTTQMVDAAALDPYGISVRDKGDNTTVLAYVPLTTVQDNQTGAPVAFEAHMYYLGNNTGWSTPHQARLTWTVQELTDICKQVPAGQDPKTWCENNANFIDATQIVHVYDDDWYLTGMEAREDRGMRVAMAYEDPAADNDRAYDDRLWALARGLASSFALGRDCASKDSASTCVRDGKRDITIADIGPRWDSQRNGASSDEARWNIPRNALRVVDLPAYPNRDYAGQIMLNDSQQVIASAFSPNGTPLTDAPTVLFANEERSRTVNLDMAGTLAVRSNNRLALHLDPGQIKERVSTGITWSPFRYSNGGWENYPVEEYLDKLEVRLKDGLPSAGFCAPNDATCLRGQIEVAKGIYLARSQGVAGLAEENGVPPTYNSNAERSDRELGTKIDTYLATGKGAVIGYDAALAAEIGFYSVDEVLRARQIQSAFPFGDAAQTDAQKYFAFIGLSLQNALGPWSDVFNISWIKQQLISRRPQRDSFIDFNPDISLDGALVLAASSAWASSKDALKQAGISNSDLAKYALGTLKFTLKVVALAKLGTVAKDGGELGLRLLQAQTMRSLGKIGKVARVVGRGVTVAGFVTPFALFAYQVTAGGIDASSPEFAFLFEKAIATSVVAGLMFAIEFIPVVGQIIAAVIALLDALAMIICTALDVDMNSAVGVWVCGGIDGTLSNGLTWLMQNAVPFSSNLLIGNLDGDDRLHIRSIDQVPIDPIKGVVAGSQMRISLTVNNTITLNGPASWIDAAQKGLYTLDNLRRSTFAYELQSTPQDIDGSLSPSAMMDQWQDLGNNSLGLTKAVSSIVTLGQAGINQSVPLYLAEGYLITGANCGLVLLGIPACSYPSYHKTNSLDLGLKLDILPATLDGFLALTPIGNGYAQAWNQTGSLPFPVLRDADGDGLLSKAFGGNDPNDSAWDADNDGMSDLMELQNGTNPSAADSDNDGLSDADELRLGTSSIRADTDGDGLTDKQEADGWDVVYDLNNGQPLVTRIASSPLVTDTDGDGTTDAKEKLYGSNPRVASEVNVLSYQAQVRENNAPRLLLRLDESVGASAFADESGFDLGAACNDTACPLLGSAGRFGTAAQFDGVNDTIAVSGADLDLSGGAYTEAAWLYPTATDGSYHGIMGYQDTRGVQFRTPGVWAYGATGIHAGFGDGTSWNSVSVPNVLALNQWNHVATTFDGTTLRVYINGVQKGTASFAGRKPVAGTQLSIGKVDTFFKGKLDDAAVFPRALSVAELQSLAAGAFNANDMVVRPNDQLAYRATVKNELLNRFADGLLTTGFPSGAAGGAAPANFSLQPQQQQTLADTIQIGNLNTSANINLAQVAGAMINERHEALSAPSLWLNLDENRNATSFADRSGANRTATCSGAACPYAGARGIGGNAAQFDGAQDYLRITNAPQLNSTYTEAAWIFPTATDNDYHGIMGYESPGGLNSRYPGMWTYEQTGVHAGFGDGTNWNSVSVPNVLTLNQWNHVATTFDGMTLRVYVNGVEKIAQPFIGRAPTQGTTLDIGRANPDKFFKGAIDNVRVYPTALAPSDIQALGNDLVLSPIISLSGREEGNEISLLPDTTDFNNYVNCRHGVGHCPTLTKGLSDAAAKFDGDDSLSVTAADTLSLSGGTFTQAAWVFPTFDSPAASRQDIFSQCESFDCYPGMYQFNRKLSVGFGTSNVAGSGKWVEYRTANDVLTLNTWNYVAATFDGVTYRIYVNGVLRDQTAIFNGLKPGSNREFSLGSGYNGLIDKPQVYRRALDNGEINKLYLRGANDLVMRFDDVTNSQSFLDDTGLSLGSCAVGACPVSGLGGRDGRAVQFDGVNDTVQALVKASTTNYGVSLWVKTNQNGQIFALGQGSKTDYVLTLYNGTLIVIVDGGLKFTDIRIVDGQWHHLVHTNVNGSHKLYVDGQLRSTLSGNPSNSLSAPDRAIIGSSLYKGLIDDVRLFHVSLSQEDVTNLYRAVPQLNVRFDEAALPFGADAGPAPTCSGATCPQAGSKGQVGQSALFDGTDDQLTLANDASTNLRANGAPFSVGVWVRPAGAKSKAQPLVLKGPSSASYSYAMVLAANGLAVRAAITGADCTSIAVLQSSRPLIQDQWSYVTLVYDGQRMQLYVNGTLDGERAISFNPCQNTDPLILGNTTTSDAQLTSFAGRMDELALYQRALGASEVARIYSDQFGWVEERQNFAVQVDADAPTSTLDTAITYLPNRDIVLGATGNDATSRVAMLELGVFNAGTNTKSWLPADLCRDSATSLAWCPVFDPTSLGGEGQYTLQTRATDVVGNVETPAVGTTLFVDATPPSFTFNTAPIFMPTPHPTRPNAWVVRLSGSISDPVIGGIGQAGSGVQASSARVTLLTPAGEPVGAGQQTVTISGRNWILDYVFPDANPSGTYQVRMEASDAVGNRRVGALGSVTLDATAPGADITSTGAFTTTIASGTTIGGTASDQPQLPGAVTRLHLEEPAGATSFADTAGLRNTATCTGNSCPSVATGQFGQARQFDGSDDVLRIKRPVQDDFSIAFWLNTTQISGDETQWWQGSGLVDGEQVGSGNDFGVSLGKGKLMFGVGNPATNIDTTIKSAPVNDGKWHHVVATRTRSTGALELYVDGWLAATGKGGTQALNGPAELRIGSLQSGVNYFNGALDEITIFDRALGADQVRALATLGGQVSRVDVAFTPSVTDSPLFNPTSPAGKVVHLPLDSGVSQSDGQTFGDISGNNRNATCSGSACPSANQSGHIGSATAFDGSDDSLRLARPIQDDFSIALWVKSAQVAGGDTSWWQGMGLVDGDLGGTGNDFGLTLGNGKALFGVGNPDITIKSATSIADNTWHQVVATRTRSTGALVLYIDGQQSTTGTGGTQSLNGPADLRIGAMLANYNFFKGALDDVQLFSRALNAAEVSALYEGSSPLLALTFDSADTRSAGTLTDSSGWEQPATLQTGTGDSANKAIAGRVGTAAVALDGSNDYVQVSDAPAFNLGTGAFAMSFWFKKDRAARADALSWKNTDSGGNDDIGIILDESQKLNLYMVVDGSGGMVITGKQPFTLNDWHHALVMRDTNGVIKTFIDGVQDGTGTSTANLSNVNAGTPLWFGANHAGNLPVSLLQGRLDDIRIYPRALSDIERQALLASAWQTATLGADGRLRSWTASVPSGLEGAYQIDLRGFDTMVNVDISGSSLGQWRGTIDTLAPRVTTFTASSTGTGASAATVYTIAIEDFNLTDKNLQSPCPASAFTREYYRAPWFLALAGANTQQLYRLVGTCTVNGQQSGATLTVADAAGNVSTATATTAVVP